MSEKEVDSLLKPLTLAADSKYMGGSGAYVRFYKLDGGDVDVHFGGSLQPKLLERWC